MVKFKALSKALLVLVFVFLLACAKTNGPNQKMPRSAFDYLEDHALSIDINTPVNLKNILPVLSNYQLIMTGETHGISANYDSEFMMLKFLAENNWLDYYLPELPFSFCYFLSQYLENGDEEILTRLFAPLQGTFTWTKEAQQHWRKVRGLYQSLPSANRFSLIGIEVEHQARNAQWMLLDLLPEGDPPAFLTQEVAQLKQLVQSNNDNYLSLYDLAMDIQSKIGFNSTEFETYLGNSIDLFIQLNDLILKTYEIRDDDVFASKRETLIFENFLQYKDVIATGNCYGQWGANHIYQNKIEEVSWLASKINNDPDSPLQDKVYSILYLYHDCKALLKNPYREVSFSNLLFVKDFKKMASGNFTLFQLDLSNSPFEEELIWPSNSVSLQAGVTTDYVQSILLIRNASAASPLN